MPRKSPPQRAEGNRFETDGAVISAPFLFVQGGFRVREIGVFALTAWIAQARMLAWI
jgi:hypothetical protein